MSTGATIKIIDTEDASVSSSTKSASNSQSQPEKKILLKGTSEQIQIAKTCIENVVAEAQHADNCMNASLSKREPRAPLSSARSPSSDGGDTSLSAKPSVPQCSVERLSPTVGTNPESQFEVYVSAMVDPSRFWLQIVGPKATKLDQLVEEMTDYYSKVENRNEHILNDVEQGKIVAAMFPVDNKWYRAEVLEIKTAEQIAELYYVDYGDTEAIPVKELFELRTDFLQLNYQAIECFLAKVEPNGEIWSEEAKDLFEDLTQVSHFL